MNSLNKQHIPWSKLLLRRFVQKSPRAVWSGNRSLEAVWSGSTLSHYENMPIQIYENFTTKKWKFSDKKIWYFWGLLSEHLVYLRYISEKRQYRTTKIQVCLRISTIWLGFWINRDSVCVTTGEFSAKFSGFHKKHILRILSKRKPLRFFKPELSLHVFVWWSLYKGNILFGHSHEYPTSLKCEPHFELWTESWFQRKTYPPLDMDGNYWKGTADVLSASFEIVLLFWQHFDFDTSF